MKAWFANLRGRFDGLVAEYGRIAIITYISLCLAMFAGIWAAMSLGFQFEGAAAQAGTMGAACLVYQGLKPVRFAVAIVLIPLVAAGVRRYRPVPAPTPENDE